MYKCTNLFQAEQTNLLSNLQSRLSNIYSTSDGIFTNIIFIYCEIIINCGVLIFVDFVVLLNHKIQNPMKYNFPIDCCLQCLKPRIQGINAFCRNHENWCQQTKILSQYMHFNFLIGIKFKLTLFPLGVDLPVPSRSGELLLDVGHLV